MSEEERIVKFIISARQNYLYEKWSEEHNKTCRSRNKDGAIGGRISWVFTIFSIGLGVRVKCACKGEGSEIDLSDYEDW